MKNRFSCNVLLFFGAMFAAAQAFSQTINRPTFSVPAFNSAGVSFCKNETFYIQFQSEVFADTNVFEIQLSDSAGNFNQPTPIGSLQRARGNNSRALCRIPAGVVESNAYRIRIKSSSPEQFSPANLHPITISASNTPMPDNDLYGDGYWKGQVYHWYSPINATLQMADTFQFFDSTKLVAAFQVSNLSFSLEMNNGSLNESTAGVSNVSGCTKGDNFSIRMRRRQYFDSGYYAFRLRGDDGIRLSTDGGSTWLVTSWVRQTNAIQCLNNCCGVFMTAGMKDLVFEFFEEAGIATAELVMEKSGPPGNIVPPVNLIGQNICASLPAFPIGFQPAGGRYAGVGIDQNGIFHPDSGSSGSRTIIYRTGIFNCLQADTVMFTVLPRPDAPVVTAVGDTEICEGESVEILSSIQAPNQWYLNGDSLIGAIDSLIFVTQSGLYTAQTTDTLGCVSYPSNEVAVLVSAFPEITVQPSDQGIFPGAEASFSVEAVGAGLEYQWQIDSSGTGFENLAESAKYEGVRTDVLTVNEVSVEDHGHRFTCIVNRNSCFDSTSAATLSLLTKLNQALNLSKPTLYPNPGSETLRITPTDVPVSTLKLFDFTGKLVLQISNPGSVSVKHLPKGIYHWQMVQEEQTFGGKWVKF